MLAPPRLGERKMGLVTATYLAEKHAKSKYLEENPRRKMLEKEIRDLDDRITALQRTAAKPYPYRFEIRRRTTP